MKHNSKKILQLARGGFLAASLLLFMSNTVVYGAGFNCTKATTGVEKYVCANQQLSELDSILAKVYAEKLKRLERTGQNKLKQNQRSWLHKRDRCMGYLPAEQWFCVLNAYKKRIGELGGMQRLIAHYKQLCAKDDWQCITVGDLELARGSLEDAIHYYGIMCKADYDGDAGGSCYKKAVLLEKRGKLDEAKALYIRTCNKRDNNEACAAALRLTSGVDKNDNWTGLYRSNTGTLFIKKESEGVYSFNMDTTWANGSMCGYTGTFTLKDGKAVVAADKEFPECRPRIINDGKSVSIKDPTGQCQHLCGIRASFAETFLMDNKLGQAKKSNND